MVERLPEGDCFHSSFIQEFRTFFLIIFFILGLMTSLSFLMSCWFIHRRLELAKMYVAKAYSIEYTALPEGPNGETGDEIITSKPTGV